MIVPMRKTYIVARRADRDRLMGALRDLGVVHVTPIDPAVAQAEADTLADIARFDRAAQILSSVEAKGIIPDISPADAAAEAVEIDRIAAEARSRLAALGRQMDQLAVWGDVTLKELAELDAAGIDMDLLSVPADDVQAVQGDLVHVITELGGKRVLLGVVGRDKEADLPDQAHALETPKTDRPTIRGEAAEIDAKLKQGSERLAQLALGVEAIAAERGELARRAEFTVACRSGLADDALFALQGWAPADRAETLAADLAAADINAAVEHHEPAEEELPPTLIRYPKWTMPIKGLFDILGTFPGYREYELSGFFMIAFPIFAAMLIGCAGYGLIFLLLSAVFYKKLVKAAGKPKTNLLIVIGAVTLLWGVLTANYFAITPDTMARAGNYMKPAPDDPGKMMADVDAIAAGTDGYAAVGRAMIAVGPMWNADGKISRDILIQVSFILALVHLCLAHLRQAIGLFPNQRFVAEVGWIFVLLGMFGVIWQMFFIGLDEPWNPLIFVALIAGGVLTIGFMHPAGSPPKRFGIGFASSLLPLLGTFGDTMSYIRLMAVGLASFYIADAFNGIAADLASVATWAAGGVVLLFGHLLNIGLAAIAIFAHGVRLNMLEFSSNASVQWAGYAYTPFAALESKEN